MHKNYSKKTSGDHSRHIRFIYRMIRSLIMATFIISVSLLIGMLGYHYFENLDWLDSFLNSSMILSGMGVVSAPKTDGGKLFEGIYALFSGIIFLVIVAILLGPLFHRFFLKLHLEETQDIKK